MSAVRPCPAATARRYGSSCRAGVATTGSSGWTGSSTTSDPGGSSRRCRCGEHYRAAGVVADTPVKVPGTGGDVHYPRHAGGWSAHASSAFRGATIRNRPTRRQLMVRRAMAGALVLALVAGVVAVIDAL